MHIAILSPLANFHTQKWAEALSAAGEKVSVFSLEKYPYNHPEIQNVCVPATFTYKGQITYFSYLDGRALRQLLASHQVDVVFAINATPFGVWAAKANFHPTIIFAVGADILEYPPAKDKAQRQAAHFWGKTEFQQDTFFSKIKRKISKAIFRYQVYQALHFCDAIMADNEVLRTATHQWFDIPLSKIQLNRGGIEPSLFLPDETLLAELRQHFRIAQNATVILSPRGMKPVYQSDIIIAAFERILAENAIPNVHFIMLSVGYDVPESLEIKAEMMMKKYSNFFFEKNVLSRQKISQLWHLIDLFISAPLYDGYSASVAEGRYMGAIPVVNQTFATEEILVHQETAWFVEPFTVDNLVASLKQIMLEKEDWKRKFAVNNADWIQQNSLMMHSVSIFLSLLNNISAQNIE